MKNPIQFLRKALALTLASLLWWSAGTCRATENQAIIDVLMVFDDSASKHIRQKGTVNGTVLHPMNEEQTAELAINQLNRVLMDSGIGNKVRFRNAGIVRSSYRTTTLLNGESPKYKPHDLTAMRSGLVEGLEKAREQSKADLVIMFTYYPIKGPCIVGAALPVELNSLYAATDTYEELYKKLGNKEGFATTFNVLTIRTGDTTFSHEVCHLLGAGHADTQFAQCGPQAEMDAAGCYPSNEAYATLMSYEDRQDPTTDDLQTKKSIPVPVLSHPGTTTFKGQEMTLGDENYHNNAAVVVRHASAVAAFRVSGREKAINDSPDEAIAMPALVPFNEKFERLMWPKFHLLLQTGDLQKIAAAIIAEDNGVDPASIDRRALTQEIWENREKAFQLFFNGEKFPFLRRKFMDDEFMRHKPEENFISCTLGTTIGGTKESGEPAPAEGTGNIVWYKVTPPCDGDLEVAVRRIITAPGFQPVMGIYYGSQKSKLKQIEHREAQATEDGAFIKSITANVPGNTPLYIAVDSARGSQPGNFCLMVRHVKGTYSGQPLTEDTADEDDKGNDEGEDEGKDKGEDEGEDEDKGSAAPTWDSLDITLLALCIVMLLSCTVMGYLLWLQSLKARLATPKSPFDNNQPGPGGKVKEQERKTDIVQINERPQAEPGFILNLQGTLSDGTPANYDIDLKAVKATRNYYIGREKTMSNFVINDPTISARHAVLKVRTDEKGEILLLGDAGSTNGTWVNGRQLFENECTKVKRGQKVQLGRCTFTISTK